MPGGFAGMSIALEKAPLDREEQAARISQMQQGIEQKDIDLSRQRREESSGLTEKESTRKGLVADYENTEQGYKNAIQEETQGVMTNQLHDMTVDSKLRQSANIWRAYQTGHKDLALKWLSDSALVSPGQKFSDMRIEDSDEKGPDGKPVRVLTMVPKGEGEKPIQVPVSILDNLEKQFGATYKVVAKSLVRIGHNSTATPGYEPDQFAPTVETGVPFSKRTGQPAAAMGVRPQLAPSPRAPAAIMGTGMMAPVSKLILPGDTPQQPPAGAEQALQQDPNAPPLTRRQETHVDTRVTHATALVNHYFGINTFTGLDPTNQPKYVKVVARAGQLVRGGTSPGAAAQTAIGEVERAEKLDRGGTGYPGPRPHTRPAPRRQSMGRLGRAHRAQKPPR